MDLNRTINLVSLTRDDAIFIRWWIPCQHPFPAVVHKLRRDLAGELAALRPMASVAFDDVETVKVLAWLGEQGTLPDVVESFRVKLAYFVEQGK